MEKEVLPLTVICPGGGWEGRAAGTLLAAVMGHPYRMLPVLTAPPETRHVLFAVHLGAGGVNEGLPPLLGWLRTHPRGLDGCVGGILVDGEGELWSRAVGRDLIQAASMAGCAFPGRPLVEGTGSLTGMRPRARELGVSPETAYRLAAADLTARIYAFSPRRRIRPGILVLHASPEGSEVLTLWGEIRSLLEGSCQIREIDLRTGARAVCGTCPYTACPHHGEEGPCLYGGTLTPELYPALREADAAVLLCGTADALPADLTAALGRMEAVYRGASFAETAVYVVAAAEGPGGDLAAGQAVSMMALDRGLWLPPWAALIEPGADPMQTRPGISRRAERFADGMLYWLRG